MVVVVSCPSFSLFSNARKEGSPSALYVYFDPKLGPSSSSVKVSPYRFLIYASVIHCICAEKGFFPQSHRVCCWWRQLRRVPSESPPFPINFFSSHSLLLESSRASQQGRARQARHLRLNRNPLSLAVPDPNGSPKRKETSDVVIKYQMKRIKCTSLCKGGTFGQVSDLSIFFLSFLERERVDMRASSKRNMRQTTQTRLTSSGKLKHRVDTGSDYFVTVRAIEGFVPAQNDKLVVRLFTQEGLDVFQTPPTLPATFLVGAGSYQIEIRSSCLVGLGTLYSGEKKGKLVLVNEPTDVVELDIPVGDGNVKVGLLFSL